MVSSVFNAVDKTYASVITHSNSQTLSLAYTFFQAACVYLESTNPHVAQHAHKIQAIFNIADMGWVYQNIDALEKKPIISDWNKRHPWSFMAGDMGIATGLVLIACVAPKLLNKYFQPYENPNELLDVRNEAGENIAPQVLKEENISITFEHPFSQLWAQYLFVVRIILNVALACLSSNRALPICNLLGQTYSLIKLSQLKWLNFSRLFRFVPNAQQLKIDDMVISYRALLTPFVQTKGVECGICLEENPTSYFCSYHPLHDACLVRNIYRKSATFAAEDSPDDQPVAITDRFNRTFYSLTKMNLPECPFRCNEKYPLHSYFEVSGNHLDKGIIEIHVNLKNQGFQPMPTLPRFFEVLNLIYSLFQTGLAYTQQNHPELINHTLNIQRVLLLADTIVLGRDYVQLYDHIKIKNEKSQTKVHYMVAAVATSLFAAAGVFLMNVSLKSSSDPNEILKKAAVLSSKGLDRINVYWNTPPMHKLSQFLTLSRIAVNLLSAFALSSRKSLLHITTASLQALTLHKISQLPWIRFEKTFATLWSSSGNQYYISKLTLDMVYDCIFPPPVVISELTLQNNSI